MRKEKVKVKCIGCEKIEELEKGYDYSHHVCKSCIKIVENLGKKHYAFLRLIADDDLGIYDHNKIVKKSEIIKEFTGFLHSKGYKI